MAGCNPPGATSSPPAGWPLDNKFDPLLAQLSTALVCACAELCANSQQNSVGVEQSAPLFPSRETPRNVSGWSCGCAHKEAKSRVYICMRKLSAHRVVAALFVKIGVITDL